MPYGSKRLTRLTARAGDVVVYRDKNGRVNHVALVESGGAPPTILTKDGDESLHRADFPWTPLRATNDPLVTNHAGPRSGRRRVLARPDRGKVSFQEGVANDLRLSRGGSVAARARGNPSHPGELRRHPFRLRPMCASVTASAVQCFGSAARLRRIDSQKEAAMATVTKQARALSGQDVARMAALIEDADKRRAEAHGAGGGRSAPP